MKLTSASAYAFQALAYMAAQKTDKPMASHIVAQARGIPERFLLKVLKPLVGVHILSSTKGPHGGYRLAKSPNQISLLDIIEAVDGSLRGFVPVGEDPNPSLNAALTKKLTASCDEAAGVLREHLGKVMLSDVLAGRR